MASKTARWFERHFASGVDEVPGVVSGVTIVDGMAIPAEAPGWGMHIDWQTLDRYCAWVQ
jgi:L-alanine-DL-glutamate epimerase-like enolase superfamily enzyme